MKVVLWLNQRSEKQIDQMQSIYGEFGSNYELVQRDIDDTQRAMASWDHYDKAIEALSAHINPIKTREANRKRATTVKDLLIKVCVPQLPRKVTS